MKWISHSPVPYSRTESWDEKTCLETSFIIIMKSLTESIPGLFRMRVLSPGVLNFSIWQRHVLYMHLKLRMAFDSLVFVIFQLPSSREKKTNKIQTVLFWVLFSHSCLNPCIWWANKIHVFPTHLHLTRQNVLFEKRTDIRQVLLNPFFFSVLVPSCRVPAPKVQGWFTALNPYAGNKREPSQNKHALLWPPLKILPLKLWVWHFVTSSISSYSGNEWGKWKKKKKRNFKKTKGNRKWLILLGCGA